MKVSDLRAEGDDVPRIFDLDEEDESRIESFIAGYVEFTYKAEFHEWPGWEDVLAEAQDVIARGCGEFCVEHVVDDHAWNIGVDRVE